MDKSNYLRSSISSTENDPNTRLAKAWTAIDWLSVIWKSDLTDKIKRSFFTSSDRVDTAIWMHHMDASKTYGEKTGWQFHKNAASCIGQVLEATPHKTAAARPPTTHHENHQIQTRHAGHCWRSKDELIGDVLLWTPSHWRAKVGRPAWTYIQQLCADTGCSLEDLPGAMDDRDVWQERVREIRASSVTWYIYIYIYILLISTETTTDTDNPLKPLDWESLPYQKTIFSINSDDSFSPSMNKIGFFFQSISC